MRASQFKALLAMLPGLSSEQLAALRSETEQIHHHSRALSSIDEAMAGAGCPHCNSFKSVKNGTGRGVQRYRCKDCSKTFNAATNTPLAHLHSKKQFFQHGECLQKGLTIRATAKELGVSVSTAFRWRHRFLEAVVGHQPRGVTGIFEADKTYFRESQKGSRKLVSPEDPTKARPPRRRTRSAAGTAGAVGTMLNGVRKVINDGVTATTISTIATGALSTTLATYLAQIEAFVAGIDQKDREKPMILAMNKNLALRFRLFTSAGGRC